MKIVICDDLESDLKVTEALCREYLAERNTEAEICCVTRFQDFSGDLPDLLILDIEMPDKSGIEIKDEFSGRGGPLILFVTGYEDYVYKAFGQNVMGFVQKPLEKEKFQWSMDNIMQLLAVGKNISLQDGSSVSTDRIVMLTTEHRYTVVHFSDGERSELQLKSLSDWEKELEETHFIRISQSTLVNCKFIKYVEGDVITLENNEKLKASRRQKKKCYEQVQEYNLKYGTPK